ncbi:MAG: YeeE/YedE family protein [Myxococcaceae bacterium]|nr:YeeE/YedE family protein [Myxococcaceae bacterium]
MKSNLVALAAGALFAAGLGLSGMAQPAKVQGFLDVTGQWDASLAFVMIGAIGVHAVALRLIARRKAPLFMPGFQPRPASKVIDGQLLAGAAIFGLGWGLAGYCPGPAFVAAGGVSPNALVFVGAMTVGMLVHRVLHQRTRAATTPA